MDTTADFQRMLRDAALRVTSADEERATARAAASGAAGVASSDSALRATEAVKIDEAPSHKGC